MAIDEDAIERSSGEPALPTYRTVADVLEKKNGSGVKLIGWTLLRSVMIGVPMLVVKVEPKKAIAGSLLASGMISLFTLVRIFNAEYEMNRAYLSSRRWAQRKTRRR